MIPDGETKRSAPIREESHAFPLLNKKLMGRTDASEEPGDCFKPLFESLPVGESSSPRRGVGVSRYNDEQDTEESVRQKGYALGFDAGKKDACEFVQEEAAPQVKSFVDALGRWNDLMMRMEANLCVQTLNMALAIAEKILGAPPQCAPAKLESVEAELKARMRQAYQVDLELNPDDIEALSALMNCSGGNWQQWAYITVNGDEQMQRGGLRVLPTDKALLADDAILRSLDALLSDASTK